jgi:hypothetical protein
MVKHSKKAKLNIMHMTVNFLGLFFRTGKIFFCLTRSSCLSVRTTDNFSASFGKSVLAHGQWFSLGTLASSNTKTGRHDIAEILRKVALKYQKSINHIDHGKVYNIM